MNLKLAGSWHEIQTSHEFALGGFQLQDLIITELKSHITYYNPMPLIGWNNSIQTGEQILYRNFFDKYNFHQWETLNL